MQRPEQPARIASRADAERLVAGVLATLADLEMVLEAETAHVRVGRIRDGLADESRKSELAAHYMRGLEAIKANAIALARFAPDRLEGLKAAHRRFSGVLEVNHTVLATARAVSEGLVRSLSEEVNKATRPQAYGPPGGQTYRPARAEPLVVSKSL